MRHDGAAQQGNHRPVIRTNAEGYCHLDHSNYGYIARYCICCDIDTLSRD